MTVDNHSDDPAPRRKEPRTRRPSSHFEGPYTGPSGQTVRDTAHIGCECGSMFATMIHRSIDISRSPELLEAYYAGRLDFANCPSCGRAHLPDIPFVAHDPDAAVFALVVSPAHRHQELELMAELWLKLAKEEVDIPFYVKHVRVVHSPDELRAVLESTPVDTDSGGAAAGQEEEQPSSDLRTVLNRERESLLEEREQLAGERERLEQGWEELRRHRESLAALSVDISTVLQTTLEDAATPGSQEVTVDFSKDLAEGRPVAEVDRWRASDSRLGLFRGDGVYLAARPGAALDAYLRPSPQVRVQLHTPGGLPLISLTVLPVGGVPAVERSLFWLVDTTDVEMVKLLQPLTERFVVSIDLYDDESRPVGSWQVQAPLEENLKLALGRSEHLLNGGCGELPDFEAAKATFEKLGANRLGQQSHSLWSGAFRSVASPVAARLALNTVEYWSRSYNEDYLLLIKSFPVGQWREIRRRVLTHAITFGIRLPPELRTLACEQGLASSQNELLAQQLENFKLISRGDRPNDLDPLQEWANWHGLLADCDEVGQDVDAQIRALARGSAQRAQHSVRMLREDAAGVDPVKSASETLVGDADILEQEDLEPAEELGDADIVDETSLDEAETAAAALASAKEAQTRGDKASEAAEGSGAEGSSKGSTDENGERSEAAARRKPTAGTLEVQEEDILALLRSEEEGTEEEDN